MPSHRSLARKAMWIVLSIATTMCVAASSSNSQQDSAVCNASIFDQLTSAEGLFTSRVPWGCSGAFDCYLDFCTCVNGTMSLTGTSTNVADGVLDLMNCAPYGPNTTSSVLEVCLMRRVRCTLLAAQAAPWAANASCRNWGHPLLDYYEALYDETLNTSTTNSSTSNTSTTTNISSSSSSTTLSPWTWDNYTSTCVVDMCGIASTGIRASTLSNGSSSGSGSNRSGLLLDVRNISVIHICRVNVTYPGVVPLADDVVPGCPAASTALAQYFGSIPVTACAAPSACIAAYCACVGGMWESSAQRCGLVTAGDVVSADMYPSTSTARACFATAMSCVLNSALSTYVPGASPLSPDKCLSWSVTVAEDYLTYYNTARSLIKQTKLWQACNATACRDNAGLVGISGITAAFSEVACAFPGVSARPTFQAYDPCPYRCPDNTCAYSIVFCACTASAAITNLQATFAQPFVLTGGVGSVPTFDLSFSLTASAFATYKSTVKNCTSYDYSPLMSFVWQLFQLSGGGSRILVLSSNRSSLVISAASQVLVHNTTYLLVAQALGILGSQVASRSWTFTAMAPSPIVSITSQGSQLRVPNSRPLVITAIIIDATLATSTMRSSAAYSWTCGVLLNGTQPCPTLTNASLTSITMSADVDLTGTYQVTYTYRGGIAQSSLIVTFVAGDLPYVRMLVSGSRFSTTLAVADTFMATQTVNIAVVVSYSSEGNAVTYTWARGLVGSTTATSIQTSSATASLSIPAASLSKASFTSVAGGVPNVINWIRVRVSSTTNPSQYGEASVPIVVVEPLLLTLLAFQHNGLGNASNTTLVGLQDTLQLEPAVVATSAPLTPITADDRGPYGSALSFTFSYFDAIPRADGTSSMTAIGLAVTPLQLIEDSNDTFAFTAVTPLCSSSGGSAAVSSSAAVDVTVTVSLSFGGVLAAQANATITVVVPSDISAVVQTETSKVASISDPAAAVVMASTLRSLTAYSSSSSTLQQYLAVAALSLLARVLSSDDVGALPAESKVSVLASISSSLVAIKSSSSSSSSNSRGFSTAATTSTPTSSQQQISYSVLIQPLVIAAMEANPDNADSFSFAYENADAILDVVQSMDMTTGGNTAISFAAALVNAPDLLVGSVMSYSSRGGTLLITVVKELASTLKSATSVGSNGGVSGSVTFSFNGATSGVLDGASLVIPPSTMSSNESLLPWMALDDTEVVAIAGTVLSASPFFIPAITTTTPTRTTASSIVVVELLLVSSVGSPSPLVVNNLPADQAWLVTIPNAGQGAVCGYFDEVLQSWMTTGVTANASTASSPPGSLPGAAAPLLCRTTHLTAFGGVLITSSAALRLVGCGGTFMVFAVLALIFQW